MFEDRNIREPILEASKLYKDPICVEVGVQKGNHAEVMKYYLNPLKLFLVDSWVNRDQMCKDVYSRFSENDNIIIMHISSYEASLTFPNEFFDIVYIDADHSYEAVSQDLHCWFPKVKHGGMLSGHDWDKPACRTRENWESLGIEVQSAVQDFLKLYPHKLNISEDRRNFWIFKV